MRSALLLTCLIAFGISVPELEAAQETTLPGKPSEHLIGTITSADAGGQTVTLKEDGSGLEHTIQLQNTRTLLKVSPGAKDLKAAIRITPADLSPGDRIDVRGSKVESDPGAIAARSLVLMSSRELQQAHQSEALAWQHSIAGTVAAVDLADKRLTINVRSADGPRPVVVDAASAVFTRYSPEHPKSPTPSQISDVQPGDQVKIIGSHTADSTSISAQRIYSGTFKTLAGTVSSIAPDGKSLVVKDLSTKQSVTIVLGDDTSIRKLPPMMANMLARRFNPDLKNAGATGSPSNASGNPANPNGAAGAPPYGAKAGEASGETAPGARPSERPSSERPSPGGHFGGGTDAAGSAHGDANSSGGPGTHGGRMANGDMSQLLDRLPKVTTADLKTGDAVVVSGSPSAANKATLLANSVIAGVEPIFQSAPGRQAQSLGDWSASLGGGAAMDAGSSPQ